LAELLEALKITDIDAFHFSYQPGDCQGQRWLFRVGLLALYGQEAKCWGDFPAVVKGENDKQDELLILGKARYSVYEKAMFFRSFFMKSF